MFYLCRNHSVLGFCCLLSFVFFSPIRWPAWAMFSLGIEKVKAPSLDGWNSFVIRKNPHAHLNNRGYFPSPDICLKYTTC